ncbi:probable linoleate 9S-lipoxygenase 5 [Chenopodium quinoa]|uniref:probable linoleate 9S-lipoxygenase 5 n=1 Tax=Chenopodium quinoa TaxID=63459 RepID=UPI000B7760AA|nr:probable linoleate 9S-lipoxygenase 5 [Chenopodium quinoa]
MFHNIIDAISGDSSSNKNKKQINGRVILMKKNVLDFNDFNASILDRFDELLGKKMSFQLVSSINTDPGNESKGKLGKPSYLGDWLKNFTGLTPGESAFNITFDWDEDIGVPGAVIIKNEHHSQFYLKSVTLEDIPDCGKINFVCNSWIYPTNRYKKDRIIFSNKTYLPDETPAPLSKYREEELEILRGTGEGKLEEWDRVYDYAYYNDLGDPDKGPKYARPVLGGSAEYPYPRRGRTGRPPTKTDPKTESRLPLLKGLDVYVPRDEKFGHIKMSDFLGYALKSLSQDFAVGLESIFDKDRNEFDSFQDELDLYEGGIKLPQGDLIEKLKDSIPFELVKAFLQTDGAPLLKFPMPDVIKEDKSAWRTDEEFAREMLAGVNPLAIRRLEVFPPVSKLDPKLYGNQNSSITKEHIQKSLGGLCVDEAIKKNKLFILDHHDTLMPFVRRINSTPSKIYATRTVLFLQNDGTLKPLAIELSLPHPEGDKLGAISKVFTPAHDGVEGSLWQLAKAYVAVNDSGHHQLISHWLLTHAVIEPFVIASNRQLSVLHPIHRLLHPHFRYTMDINAVARQVLLNAEGLLEKTVFPRQYSMELSSAVYKSWVFTDQAVPNDLVKRGVAVKDAHSPHGYKLLIEDYPYAVDALDIWSAIETWVKEYCSFYYKSDDMICKDIELQSWWKEIREKGHGDKKDEKWWPDMKTFNELTQTCTTIIWIASALHAAVNFGQYPYAGYHPNRPTVSRRLMPEPNTPEYEELEKKPDNVFLKTISNKFQSVLGISLIELLSRHPSDEIYLGQRETREWTADTKPLEAFEKFGKTLEEIEDKIVERNKDEKQKNRVGPVKMPYTLLYPTSDAGLTGRGIPNSTSV